MRPKWAELAQAPGRVKDFSEASRKTLPPIETHKPRLIRFAGVFTLCVSKPIGQWTGDEPPTDHDWVGVPPGAAADFAAGNRRTTIEPLPPYSTDIAAAWTVFDRLCQSEFQCTTGDPNDGATILNCQIFPGRLHWGCHFWTADNEWVGHAEEDTAPIAICRAALQVVARKDKK